MFHYIYILENEKKEWYIGYTSNIHQRIKDHNQNKNVSTRGYKWKIIYAEAYLNKKDALSREKFLKSGSGRKFIKKQIKNYLLNNSHANQKKKAKTKTRNRTKKKNSHQRDD